MQDLTPNPNATGRSVQQRFFDGATRNVWVTDQEIPYPPGRLIVSRTDRAGRITDVNESFCEISGYTKEELLGEPHCILRHPDMPAAAFQDLWQTVQQGKVWHGYVKNLCKDGRHYWVYATVIPNLRGGVIVGYTSVRREPSRAKVEEAEAAYRALAGT